MAIPCWCLSGKADVCVSKLTGGMVECAVSPPILSGLSRGFVWRGGKIMP